MTFLKHYKLYLVIALLAVFAAACSSENPGGSGGVKTASSPPPLQPGEEVAVIETDFGKFKFRFFPDVAPKHVENFKKLAREGFYNGLAFHRVSPNFLIQGGDPTTRGDDRSRWGMGEPNQPTIPAEFSTRPFVPGTVGAARAQDLDSATSQFFVTLKEYPNWNGEYTVFGEVIEGLNIVQIISNAPTEPGTETVAEKVVMKRVYLEPYQKK
jgi:peptidyl-prolyl cis-trans isomerase B (cyclophilin B)